MNQFPVVLQVPATTVTIDDEMDVILSVTFESAESNRITVSRPYRFDSDHQSMGAVSIWHHLGDWPSPDRVEWGGPDRLHSAELHRSKFIAEFSPTGPRHPEGWDIVEVTLNLAADEFNRLRTSLNRCFEGFSRFAERIEEASATVNAGVATLLREPVKLRSS